MKILKALIGKTIILGLATLCLSAVDTNAQPVPIEEITTNKYALSNLIHGIKSTNCGVKRSAIYFAGKYRIHEAKDVLLEQLKIEPEPCTRILITLVLYELDDLESLWSVRNLSKTEHDRGVKSTATNMYYKFLNNDD